MRSPEDLGRVLLHAANVAAVANGLPKMPWEELPAASRSMYAEAAVRFLADVGEPAATPCGNRVEDFDERPCVLPKGHDASHIDVNGATWPVRPRGPGPRARLRALRDAALTRAEGGIPGVVQDAAAVVAAQLTLALAASRPRK